MLSGALCGIPQERSWEIFKLKIKTIEPLKVHKAWGPAEVSFILVDMGRKHSRNAKPIGWWSFCSPYLGSKDTLRTNLTALDFSSVQSQPTRDGHCCQPLSS